MADAGSIYFQALSGLGQNIAGAMNQYHKEHVAYDEQEQIAQVLSRMGVNEQGQLAMIDPNSKDKSIQPIIDPRAFEMFTAANTKNRAKATGALEALNKIGMGVMAQSLGPLKAEQLKQERLQSTLYQRAVDQPIGRLGTGETVVNTPHGVSVQGGRGMATTVAEAGRAARYRATQALKARKDLLTQFIPQFEEYGITNPSEFILDNWQAGDLSKEGKFVPLEEGKVGGSHLRLGDTGTPIPKARFIQGRRLAAEYQKLGQIGYGGLTGGQQTDVVRVQTREEAARLAPGTLYIPPGGDPNHPYQIPY